VLSIALAAIVCLYPQLGRRVWLAISRVGRG
jgi:hypothetical protein